ncbi:MAG: hypothetical protein JNL38_06190 [Myxococcales bacterium]|nr:hypothetical protein [Myxococcales bacterium]
MGCGLTTIGERPDEPGKDASVDTYVDPGPDVRWEAGPPPDAGIDAEPDAPPVFPSNLPPGFAGVDGGDGGVVTIGAVDPVTINTSSPPVVTGTIEGDHALLETADGKYVVLVGGSVVVTTNVLTVTGPRPLILVSLGDLVVDQGVAANAVHELAGPGGLDAGPGVGHTATGGSSSQAGGGGGAGHATAGANGGPGATGTVPGDAGAAYGSALTLTAGSAGGAGKINNASPPCSFGGGGGGAIQLSAFGKLFVVGPSAVLNVSGGGGRGGCNNSGGGGGGSGGTLLLEAKKAVVLNGGVLLSAGGGGGGAGSGSPGGDGLDPDPLNPLAAAAGGGRNGGSEGDGGHGGWEAGLPTPGSKGNSRGGGGGGAVGRIVVRGTVEVLDASVASPSFVVTK